MTMRVMEEEKMTELEGDKCSQQSWDTSYDSVLDVQEGQRMLHQLLTREKNGSHSL